MFCMLCSAIVWLFGTKSLAETLMTYRQFEPHEILNEIWVRIQQFSYKNKSEYEWSTMCTFDNIYYKEQEYINALTMILQKLFFCLLEEAHTHVMIYIYISYI